MLSQYVVTWLLAAQKISHHFQPRASMWHMMTHGWNLPRCSISDHPPAMISNRLSDMCVCTYQLSISSGMHTGRWERSLSLCSHETECEEGKSVFICAASLKKTFSKPHPALLTQSQVSWNSYKMKSTWVCPDYWTKAPNWNTKTNAGNLKWNPSLAGQQNKTPNSSELFYWERGRLNVSSLVTAMKWTSTPLPLLY